jgi:hypothetical protein
MLATGRLHGTGDRAFAGPKVEEGAGCGYAAEAEALKLIYEKDGQCGTLRILHNLCVKACFEIWASTGL